MCTNRRSGFTLIELIVFIVIVSVALAGVLAVYNVVVKGSADPVREKQAVAAAESLLEEILAKPFCDPDTVTLAEEGAAVPAPSTCGLHTNEIVGDDRRLADDVDDYHGYATNGIRDITSPSTVVLGEYNVEVQVGQPSEAINTVPKEQIRIVDVTVTDTRTGRSYTLTGYKFNND